MIHPCEVPEDTVSEEEETPDPPPDGDSTSDRLEELFKDDPPTVLAAIDFVMDGLKKVPMSKRLAATLQMWEVGKWKELPSQVRAVSFLVPKKHAQFCDEVVAEAGLPLVTQFRGSPEDTEIIRTYLVPHYFNIRLLQRLFSDNIFLPSAMTVAPPGLHIGRLKNGLMLAPYASKILSLNPEDASAMYDTYTFDPTSVRDDSAKLADELEWKRPPEGPCEYVVMKIPSEKMSDLAGTSMTELTEMLTALDKDDRLFFVPYGDAIVVVDAFGGSSAVLRSHNIISALKQIAPSMELFCHGFGEVRWEGEDQYSILGFPKAKSL